MKKKNTFAQSTFDFSTAELRVSQKMFRFRGAAAVDPSAARAAGLINTDLGLHLRAVHSARRSQQTCFVCRWSLFAVWSRGLPTVGIAKQPKRTMLFWQNKCRAGSLIAIASVLDAT